jgi:hypothetical protein
LVFITKNLKKDKELKEFYHCDEIGIKNIFAQKSILLILKFLDKKVGASRRTRTIFVGN